MKINFVSLGPLVIGIIKELPKTLTELSWAPSGSRYEFIVQEDKRNLLGIFQNKVTLYLAPENAITQENQILYEEADTCEEAEKLAILLDDFIQTYNGFTK